ncbi:myelin protein zero-like protein 3 isoform X1 [Sebastes fasciatus]|uniref:myelin protein zero-like protein 3 isoform X1 n=1 Tax=Sebastes fasciatus TaxID=394691 RepID=UPI003D9E88E8
MRVNPFPQLKMRRPHEGNTALNVVLLLYLFGSLAPSLVSSITVNTPAELHAFKGDTVTLSCTFTSTSTPTSKMTVDWSYRPQSGGPPLTVSFFHFSSRAFLPPDGQFSGRIRWQGTPARGEASIALINATLNDNGTYTCSVRNPPDVHGSPTSHTVLTVTPKAPSIRFSDVAVLLAFILLPSAIITLILIGRMLCPKKQRSQSKAYRSPIEVTEGEEYGVHPPEAKEKRASCCDLYMLDSEDEDEYYDEKKMPPVDEVYAESQF